MTQEAVAKLKTFSPRHRQYIQAVLAEIMSYYGANLSGLAIFGSYARGENRKNSDLDLLIVLQTAPRMRERLGQFVDAIEMKHEQLAQRLYTQEEIFCELSPYILTEAEALTVQPIYYDFVTYHIVVADPKQIVQRILHSMAQLLRDTGAYRVRRNNTWEWHTGRFLGGTAL